MSVVEYKPIDVSEGDCVAKLAALNPDDEPMIETHLWAFMEHYYPEGKFDYLEALKKYLSENGVDPYEPAEGKFPLMKTLQTIMNHFGHMRIRGLGSEGWRSRRGKGCVSIGI